MLNCYHSRYQLAIGYNFSLLHYLQMFMEKFQAAEDEVAMDQDADQIRQVIESEESEEHPLKVLGEDMCAIGEKIILGIEDPFLGYSEAQIEQFIQKIAPTESNKRRTKL